MKSRKERKMMRRRVWITGLAAVLVVAIALLFLGTRKVHASSPQAVPSAVEATIDNFSFKPATLIVPVGTTIVWTNRDDIPHTVVSTDDPRAFKSKVLDTDEKFSYTFTKAGTFPYFCSVHPKMTGQVVVQ
jgi:plastocyanin